MSQFLLDLPLSPLEPVESGITHTSLITLMVDKDEGETKILKVQTPVNGNTKRKKQNFLNGNLFSFSSFEFP